jgi:integrase
MAERFEFKPKKLEALTPPAIGQREVYDTVVPWLALRITDKGRRSFTVMYRPKGGRHKGKLRRATFAEGTGLADARDMAREVRLLAAKGIDWNDEQKKKLAEITPTKGLETWSEVVDDYIEKYQIGKKGNRQHGEVKRILLAPGWSDRTFREINNEDIHEALDALMAAETPYAANNLHKCLRTFYKWAWSRRKTLKLIENPMDGIERPFEATAERKRHWSDDEIVQLWGAANALGGVLGGYLKILILTGQRRNEVAGMRWSEIDDSADAWTWTIPPERLKNKGGKHRDRPFVVPLPSLAKRVLQAQSRIEGEDLVFPGRVKGKPMNGWSKHKQKISTASKIKDFTFHDARRTLATNLAALGVLPHVQSVCLGHTLQGVTEKHYNKYAYLEEKREAFEKWAQHVSKVLWPDGVVRLHG